MRYLAVALITLALGLPLSIASADKPPPVSPILPVSTPVVPEKGRYGGDTSVGIGLDGKAADEAPRWVVGGNDGRRAVRLDSHDISAVMPTGVLGGGTVDIVLLTADDPIFNAQFVVEGVGVISIPDAPVEWGAEALAVFQCESGWRPGAVGPGGYGIPQVGPIHFPAMRTHGLDPTSERDLIQYAYWLYVWHGWRVPWVHCGPLAEGAVVAKGE